MSSTSPLPPAPNAQRLAPQLPRLLWRELHLLAPLWIALYALGAILITGFFLTYLSKLTESDIVVSTLNTTGFVSAIFLVSSLLVTFALERENYEDNFSFHRGLPPQPIFITKALLPLTMFLAMIAMLLVTGFIIANLCSSISFNDAVSLERFKPSNSFIPTILGLFFVALITTAWTILFSLQTRKVIHALLLTIAALIANYIYCIFIDQLLVSSPLRTPATFSLSHALTFCILALLPLMTTIAVLHYRPQLLELLSHLRLTRTPSPPKPIHVTTNPPPLETSTWKHLGWLHIREQSPLLIAAFVVIATSFIQPMLATYPINETFFGNLEKYPFYVASILFLLFSGTLTFAPEHTHSHYRFWSDRGLSPTLIFRSRMLRYSLILLTTLGISVILFTTTDAIINRNNSLLFAFDSGQLFHLDDTTKTATLFFAQYLLTAIPVGIFWSWICRQLIMSIVMTAFSMLFCFAYGNWASISNDWPYLVTHAPFLIAIIACVWYLFPERFQLQPRTRLWLLPTLAAPLALFLSIGDILIYRVLEVPSVSASLASNGPLESSLLLQPENKPFADQLKSIQARLSPRPIPPNWSSFTEFDFSAECYGYGNLDPVLRTWTEENLALAIELETLLIRTPISDMRLSLASSLDPKFNLGSLPDLLIYSAKRKEQQGDLPGALNSYTAADRFAEFMTFYNAAYITARINLRAKIARNMASYVAHPDARIEDLLPFLRISIHQLPTTPDWSTQRWRTFNQLVAYPKNRLDNLGTDLSQRSSQELWERFPIAFLPTERWRYNRVLALWTNNLHDRNVYLLWHENFPHFSYYSILSASSEILEDSRRLELCQRFEASTPLFELYKAQFDWSIDSYMQMKNDHDSLVQLTNAQARLLIVFAERRTNTTITSIDQLIDFYTKAKTNSDTEKRIEAFLTFNQLKMRSTNQLHESVQNSLPKETQRTINSHSSSDSPELVLPLPNFVPLTLASEH